METENQIEQKLMNYISDHKIINTHSHYSVFIFTSVKLLIMVLVRLFAGTIY